MNCKLSKEDFLIGESFEEFEKRKIQVMKKLQSTFLTIVK